MRILVFVLGVILFSACKQQKETKTIKKINKQTFTFKKEAEVVIFKKDSTKVVVLDTEIAATPYERETGLMHRKNMQDNQAMLFTFDQEAPRYFYMKNTYIALDIIYLNKALQIVSFAKNARALDETSLPSYKPAQYVLEVKAGLVDAWNLKEQDYISYKMLP